MSTEQEIKEEFQNPAKFPMVEKECYTWEELALMPKMYKSGRIEYPQIGDCYTDFENFDGYTSIWNGNEWLRKQVSSSGPAKLYKWGGEKSPQTEKIELELDTLQEEYNKVVEDRDFFKALYIRSNKDYEQLFDKYIREKV